MYLLKAGHFVKFVFNWLEGQEVDFTGRWLISYSHKIRYMKITGERGRSQQIYFVDWWGKYNTCIIDKSGVKCKYCVF